MEFMDESERFQQGNLTHERLDPLRKEVFEFFMVAADQGELTEKQAILNTQAMLGIIAVHDAEGQPGLF